MFHITRTATVTVTVKKKKIKYTHTHTPQNKQPRGILFYLIMGKTEHNPRIIVAVKQ